MSAIEFVKEHGIEYTTGIVVGCESGFLPKNDNYFDLKQIVEAWELVQSYGGLKSSIETHNCFKNACDGVGIKHSPKMVILKQAINLVEQCQ